MSNGDLLTSLRTADVKNTQNKYFSKQLQHQNLLSKVWEKYLMVFAMSTPDGRGTVLWRRRWWKSWRLRSFAWTVEGRRRRIISSESFRDSFLHKTFSSTPFLFCAKIFISIFAAKIQFYLQAAARVPMLMSCTLNDIYFFLFTFPLPTNWTFLIYKVDKRTKDEENQFLFVNFLAMKQFSTLS